MRRDRLSRPIRLALLHEILRPGYTLLDYGCGRGDDVDALAADGYRATGWDPAHRPDSPRRKSDVVNLGYVLNVIEDPAERADVLRHAWRLARRSLVVSARLEDERDEAHVATFRDGWITRRGTFQKFFGHEELGAWIRSTIGADPVAAGLGVFYVFRDAAERETYLASRFRRPVSLPQSRPSDELFTEHEDLLRPLINFIADRGRLPHPSELDHSSALIAAFGSLKRAFRVVLWVTDAKAWEHVRQERCIDLTVHAALARFHGRPRWSDLPPEMQRDVRAFFPSYKSVCQQADRLLFATANPAAVALACRVARVGKVTPGALYVHLSALNDLPALLRVYEGCARAIVGTIEDATLVKLSRRDHTVSYLSYPAFDSDPHPALAKSVLCDLQKADVRTQVFGDRDNPPILHRKELFVAPSYALRSRFASLTAQEEALGLYRSLDLIGTRRGWTAVCDDAGVTFRGHRLLRRRATGAP